MSQGVAVPVIVTRRQRRTRGQDRTRCDSRIQAIIDRAALGGATAPHRDRGHGGMPNLGAGYVRRFREIFPALARANHVELVPFLLEGVAGVDSLNQGDGIHPTEAGHRIVAENVWRVLEKVTRP
jgi:acyl-CoA thioesterase-1